MTVRQMTSDELIEACGILSYHPHSNISGLCNGSARILYDGWTCPKRPGGMVYVHSLIPEPRFMTKTFLREMFRYAFSNVDWIMGVTPGFNTRALAFNKRLGLDVSLILKNGHGPGIDLYFQTMHYRDCQYWRRPEEASL